VSLGPKPASVGIDPGLLLGSAVAGLFFLAGLFDITATGPANLVLLLLLSATALVCAYARPRWYLALLTAYFPFSMRYPFVVGLGFNMTNLLLALGLVCLASSAFEKRVRYPFGWFERLLVAFVVFGFLGFARSYGDASHLGAAFHLTLLKRWISPILFFFLFRAMLQDREDIARLLKLMAFTTTLAGVLTWWAAIDRGPRSSIEASRISGIFNGPNEMGTFLVYAGMPLLAVAMSRTSFRKRVLYFLAFLLCTRAMLFTFSRGAYVSLVVGSSVVLFFRGPIHFAVGAVGTGAAALARPELVPDSVRARLEETTTTDTGYGPPEYDRSVSHRFILWGAAMRIIRDYPLTGVGLGRFGYYVDRYAEVPLRPQDPRDVHNAYLLIATELGIPALLVFLGVLATFLGNALLLFLRRRNAFDRLVAVSTLGAVVALSCTFMLGSRLADENYIAYFWTLAAMVIVLRHLPPLSPRSFRKGAAG
jgi:O-antigen ligase